VDSNQNLRILINTGSGFGGGNGTIYDLYKVGDGTPADTVAFGVAFSHILISKAPDSATQAILDAQ